MRNSCLPLAHTCCMHSPLTSSVYVSSTANVRASFKAGEDAFKAAAEGGYKADFTRLAKELKESAVAPRDPQPTRHFSTHLKAGERRAIERCAISWWRHLLVRHFMVAPFKLNPLAIPTQFQHTRLDTSLRPPMQIWVAGPPRSPSGAWPWSATTGRSACETVAAAP